MFRMGFAAVFEPCAGSDYGSGARFSKNLRKNPKFSVSFSYVYVKFIESYKVKIFTEF